MTASAWRPPAILEFPNGLTVAELKALVKDWPEVDEIGEPTEVWFVTGPCESSLVYGLSTLNLRESEGWSTADLLLS